MTAVLTHIAVGAASALVALRVNARRLSVAREKAGWSDERHDAWNLNAMATDHDVVGPVTPPRGVAAVDVEPFMAESGYRPPRPCNVCGHPAVWAWEIEGFPFGACDLCVPLWFSDELPGHVRQVDALQDADGPHGRARSEP